MAEFTERELLLHCAKVYVREARSRRKRDPNFSATLLGWAINARRKAYAIDNRPAQGDLFA
jgi:hypothetical protein